MENFTLVKDIMLTGKKLPVLDHKKSIDSAIKMMNKKKLGLVVVTKKKFISGILTDGDARRGIKKFSKNEKVEKIYDKKSKDGKSGHLCLKSTFNYE